MKHHSKWIGSRIGEKKLSLVARAAVRKRLAPVFDYLPKAATQPERDMEHIHQLRVWTRRAIAAMDTFSELLPRKRAARIRKKLREIRRAAGGARDLDVLGQRLQVEAEQDPNTVPPAALDAVRAGRADAQFPVRRIYRWAKRKHFQRECRELARRVRWKWKAPEPAFDVAARKALAGRVEDFFAASSKDLTDQDTLHQLRIAGKRLRYTMELTAGAFSEDFRSTLYPVFADVQERLGAINDHATAEAMFTQWHDATGEAVFRDLAAWEKERFEASAAQFLQWWTPQQARELKHAFCRILGEVLPSLPDPPGSDVTGEPANRRDPGIVETRKKPRRGRKMATGA